MLLRRSVACSAMRRMLRSPSACGTKHGVETIFERIDGACDGLDRFPQFGQFGLGLGL